MGGKKPPIPRPVITLLPVDIPLGNLYRVAHSSLLGRSGTLGIVNFELDGIQGSFPLLSNSCLNLFLLTSSVSISCHLLVHDGLTSNTPQEVAFFFFMLPQTSACRLRICQDTISCMRLGFSRRSDSFFVLHAGAADHRLLM